MVSGSMEPAIPVGSVAYTCDWIAQEDIKEGDIIAYKLGEGMDVLHRVIEKNKSQKVWVTKGDANETADVGKISYEQYLGKMVMHIPYVGYVLRGIQKKHILFFPLLIAIFCMLL